MEHNYRAAEEMVQSMRAALLDFGVRYVGFNLFPLVPMVVTGRFVPMMLLLTFSASTVLLVLALWKPVGRYLVWRNERIEASEGRIVFWNLFGRRDSEGDARSVRFVRVENFDVPWPKTYVFKVGERTFRVFDNISDRDRLFEELGFKPEDSRSLVPESLGHRH